MSMSIDGYASQISDLYKTTNGQEATKMDATLSKDYSQATDEELMDVCKQFEAYFLEQMMKQMEKMVPKNDEDKDSSTSQLVDYFKDTVIQEMASQSTQTQGLGIAQQLYEAMKREYRL